MHEHSNGFRYVGEWHDDMEDGFGRNIWPDGSWYEGNYQRGLQHGRGKFVVVNGQDTLFEYDGDWADGKQNGVGIQTEVDGSKKKGVWIDGNLEKWIEEFEPMPNNALDSSGNRSDPKYDLSSNFQSSLDFEQTRTSAKAKLNRMTSSQALIEHIR